VNSWQVLNIARAVYLLALDSPSQKAYLEARALAPLADESALCFHDAYQVGQLLDLNDLTRAERVVLKSLDQLLDRLNGWDVSNLDDPEWQEVRREAKRFMEM
jgi:hypothetical protein